MVEGDAHLVSQAMVDICEFLRDGAIDRLDGGLLPLASRALYHGPCQLRGHGMGWPATEVLSRIPGLRLSLSKSTCCGVAGTYGYDRDKRDIAVAVGNSLREQITEEDPDFVVCDSETCRWNIEAMTGRPCFHPIEVLAASLAAVQNIDHPLSHFHTSGVAQS
jgi:glycerol-3-phosphate dehydrogenase subunit C